MQKNKVLTQEMRKLYDFCAIFETYRQTLCLIEVLYAVKRDLIEFIGS